MRKLWLAACLLTAGGALQATTVTATAIFNSDSIVPGVFGAWTFAYSTSDPAVKLTSVTIDLAPTGLFLDTDLFTGPGAALSLDISLITGAGATGFTGLTTPGTRDGATTFTLAFTDFGHGESFGFEMDVDECSNDFSSAAVTLACSLVNGAEFAGAKVSFFFTGPDGSNTQVATFLDRTETDQTWDAIASFSGEIPEPATWMLLGSALAAAAVLRQRRS